MSLPLATSYKILREYHWFRIRLVRFFVRNYTHVNLSSDLTSAGFFVLGP